MSAAPQPHANHSIGDAAGCQPPALQNHVRCAAPDRSEGAGVPPDGRGALGLVGLVTSGTWDPLNREFQRKRRLSRMRRAVLNGGDVLQEGYVKGGFRRRAVLLTLTYRDTGAWRSRHVSDLLRHCRQWAARRGHVLGYVWTAELQKRGAVHFHVVLWLPRGLTLPKPDKQGWWAHGSTRVEWARKPVGYLVKYASKGDDVLRFPRGLRLHGRGGLSCDQRQRVSWWLLPRYVRSHFAPEDRTIRAPGGGWVSRQTGEIIDAWRPPDPRCVA